MIEKFFRFLISCGLLWLSSVACIFEMHVDGVYQSSKIKITGKTNIPFSKIKFYSDPRCLFNELTSSPQQVRASGSNFEAELNLPQETITSVYIDDDDPISENHCYYAGTFDTTTGKAKFEVGVVSLAIYPLTPKNEIIDQKIAVPSGSTYLRFRSSVHRSRDALLRMGAEASRFRPWQNPNAVSSVKHVLVKHFDFSRELPINYRIRKDGRPEVDASSLLDDLNICYYVRQQNVKQVWIFFERQKNQSDFSWPEWFVNSKYLDYSHSWYRPIGPDCGMSYTILFHTFLREDQLNHVWAHSIENMMTGVDSNLYNLWRGTKDYYAALKGGYSRCGSVHSTPNTTKEYELNRHESSASDCLDWNPDGVDGHGAISQIGCAAWGCDKDFIFPPQAEDNLERSYQSWHLQTMPGNGNTITYKGKALRDWWEVYADFDTMMQQKLKLTR